MKTETKFPSKDRYGAIGLGFSIATVYVILVAHASAASFKAGYLSYFGIDIRHVNYWPSIADFMNEPIVVFGAIVIFVLLYVGSVLLINFIHWAAQKLAKKYRWKWVQENVEEKPFGLKITLGVLITLFLFLSIKLPFYDAYDRGVAAAEDQKNFTVVVSNEIKKQALIYQDGQTGLFKVYDTSAKSFSRSYEPEDITGLSLEAVQLVK